MAPILIVLGLLVLGVAIVAWATRRKPGQTPRPHHEQDVNWNDLLTRAGSVPPPATNDAADDPFAHAPPVGDEERHP